MVFADKLAAEIAAYIQSQKVRAWALATGLLAAIYSIGIAVLAGSVVFAAPSFETILALLWAGGAIAGATSLLVLGAIREPPELVRKAAHVGLWVGNFVASGNILVFPIVFPLALVPVVGGSIVLWQESVFGGALYMSLPFMSLAVIVVAWLVGIPLGAA